MTRVVDVNPFARPTTTAVAPDVPAPVPPSGPAGLLVRALVAVALIAGWVQLAQTPAQRPIEDLLWGLRTGEVTSVEIDKPPAGGSGSFPVRWEGSHRPSYSTYHHPVPRDGDGEVTDERSEIISEARRAGVEVTERAARPAAGGVHWQLAGIAMLTGLFLLVAGPQPRLATKWAWFWLTLAVPPAWLAFVVLEPTRWGRRAPQRQAARRLTAGWALLLGIVLAAVLAGIPWYRELFRR